MFGYGQSCWFYRSRVAAPGRALAPRFAPGENPFSLSEAPQRLEATMSVVKPVRSKRFLATLSVLVVVAGMLFGARVAVADSVWYQSYGRVSQTEACTAQVGETPWQASWGADSSWYPTWEQWANKGTGGWTCGRSITWARDSAARTNALGDVGPGGGTIFYVDMSRAAGSQFWEVGSDLGTAVWGCSETDISGTGMAIGTGATNTGLINVGCGTAGIAARVASAPAGGFSDWFLPSKDELNQLCKYARTQSTAVVDQAVVCAITGTLLPGFASDDYWSSSQYGAGDAWLQDFDGGGQGSGGKGSTLRVRPVRSF